MESASEKTAETTVTQENLLQAFAPITLSDIFVLTYMKSGDPRALYFVHPGGDLFKAVGRAKRFCEITRVRFLQCRPFITDLAKEEKRMEGF